MTQMKTVDIPKEFRMAEGTSSKEWAGALNVTGEDKSGRMSCRPEVGTLRMVQWRWSRRSGGEMRHSLGCCY